MQYNRILFGVFLVAFLQACVSDETWFPGVYKIDIQQGTVLQQDKIDQLRFGMTKSQVHFLLGASLLANFNQNRWDYVYTMQLGGEKKIVTKKLSVLFKDNKVINVKGDFLLKLNGSKK